MSIPIRQEAVYSLARALAPQAYSLSKKLQEGTRLMILRDMASPSNRKNPQPQEGTEFPPMDLAKFAKQKKV